MQWDLMKKTMVGSLIFFVIAMTGIIFLSERKVITISNVAQDEVQESADAGRKGEMEQSLIFDLGEADTSYLRIPLPGASKADNIVIENHYMNQEFWIQVPASEENFYEENRISGNREMVIEGFYEENDENYMLKFRLTGIYECRTILENENLYISFQTPREIYDRIVVIDPIGGGKNHGRTTEELKEKDIALQIAQKLKTKLDAGDIKAYYTRMDDMNPSEEDRILLANETRADMYIRIQVSDDKDASVYGIESIYNGDYFIPGFGSVELADVLEREVVTGVKGKALGLSEAENEDYTIKKATVPAAAVSVGYITNPQEAILLDRAEYQDKIAEGIYQGILHAYEQK